MSILTVPLFCYWGCCLIGDIWNTGVVIPHLTVTLIYPCEHGQSDGTVIFALEGTCAYFPMCHNGYWEQ